MKEVLDKRRAAKALIALAMVVSLAALLSGCWPFNAVPVAVITASPLSGQAPLTVHFNALLSYDPDGTIKTWDWDFGDGLTGSGKSVDHLYTTGATRTVVLVITDDGGAQSTATVSIVILPGETPGDGGATGPTAKFTATPISGASPMAVTFNASASTYAGHDITSYQWDFGDGTHSSGITASHTYVPSVTTTYHVVLTVIGSDNKDGTASQDILVTVSGGTPSSAPTASFTVDHNSIVAPLKVTFDPAGSGAATGRTIVNYIWTFGDGTAPTSVGSKTAQTHRFVTSQPSQVFTVTLVVIDDQGTVNSTTRTVTVQNYTPVAGFQIFDKLQAGTPLYTDATWKNEDMTFNDILQTGSRMVWFQSRRPDSWRNATPTTPGTEPTPKSSSPGLYTANNLSYDPEGQGWDAGVPSGFPSIAWGIQEIRYDFGDGNTRTVLDDTLYTEGTGLFAVVSHEYALESAGTHKQWTVTIRVFDYLGQQATFSRKVYFNFK